MDFWTFMTTVYIPALWKMGVPVWLLLFLIIPVLTDKIEAWNNRRRERRIEDFILFLRK